jgi:carboxylate-amine ligase
VRTVGVEEELLVVDPVTCTVTSRAPAVLAAHGSRPGDGAAGSGDGDLDAELFRHQLETRTEPTHDIEDLVSQVVAARHAAADDAASEGLAVAASATAPLGVDEPEVSSSDRYRAMLETYGDVARHGTTCGMHVHVAIESKEEGVGCLDRMAPWLPVLLAISTNSPFAHGRDTSYASWRTQMWSSWPSAGTAQAFGSLAGYDRACERMIASGAARDRAMLYWDARLSETQPTVEVRILDVVTDVADAGLLAALVRGLVQTTAAQWADDSPLLLWRTEELRAARWRAARDGLAGQLLDPLTHELRPARDVVAELVRLVADQLDTTGDADLVEAGVARVRGMTGASRQRAAFERSGSVQGVLQDVVTRTSEF